MAGGKKGEAVSASKRLPFCASPISSWRGGTARLAASFDESVAATFALPFARRRDLQRRNRCYWGVVNGVQSTNPSRLRRPGAIRYVRFTEGFRTPALGRRAGPGAGAGVRKPRKGETAGRKRRGLAGRDLWGFEGRGRIADVAAGAKGGRRCRRERTRRAFSGARMRAAGMGAASGERPRRS